MTRYTFSIDIHTKEHPVRDKKTRNKIICMLQDIVDTLIDVNGSVVDDQGYILGEDDRPISHVRIFDKEDSNQLPF